MTSFTAAFPIPLFFASPKCSGIEGRNNSNYPPVVITDDEVLLLHIILHDLERLIYSREQILSQAWTQVYHI